MKAEISKTFKFDAGHQLPNVPADHKCAARHGHTYHLTIVIAGEVDEAQGWVTDFGRIKQVIEPLIAQLDHGWLNDVEGLENPTSELIARWFWDRAAPELPGLAAVTLSETESSSCTYRGE